MVSQNELIHKLVLILLLNLCQGWQGQTMYIYSPPPPPPPPPPTPLLGAKAAPVCPPQTDCSHLARDSSLHCTILYSVCTQYKK